MREFGPVPSVSCEAGSWSRSRREYCVFHQGRSPRELEPDPAFLGTTPQNLDPSLPDTELASALSRALGGPTIVQKGRDDRITNGHETLVSSVTGSSRRCGGQGDVLSGAVGTFLAWGKNYEEREAKDEECVLAGVLLSSSVACR